MCPTFARHCSRNLIYINAFHQYTSNEAQFIIFIFKMRNQEHRDIIELAQVIETDIFIQKAWIHSLYTGKLTFTLSFFPGESRTFMSDCDPMDCPWNSPGQNTGVGSLFLLRGIFPTRGSNPGLQNYRRILYQLSHNGSPRTLEWVAYPFSRGSCRPLVCVYVLGTQSCLTLCDPIDCSPQSPLSVGLSRQEYQSELPFPSPGDLPDPGIEPRSPALQTDSLPSEPPGKFIHSDSDLNAKS